MLRRSFPLFIVAASSLAFGFVSGDEKEIEQILARFDAAGCSFIELDVEDPFGPGKALSCFAPEKFDAKALDLLPKVSDVTRVLLTKDNQFSAAVLARLPELSTVTGVRILDGGEFDDTALERLSKAERLASVSILASKFSPEALEGLGALRQAERLSIGCEEGTFDLAAFGHLEKLRYLELRTPRRVPDSLATLASFPRLESLRLWVQLTPEKQPVQDLSGLDGFADLQSVDLMGFRLAKGNVTTLAGLPKLDSLELTGCGIEGAELSALAGKKLKTLALAGPGVGYARGKPANDVRDEHLKALEGLDVETLRLCGLPLTSEGFASVATMKSVRKLDLGFIPIDAGDLEMLSKLTQVRELDLPGCGEFGEAEMRMLAAMPELVDLNLARTTISAEGLAQLAHAPKLQELFLYSAEVDPEAVAALKKARPELKINGQ